MALKVGVGKLIIISLFLFQKKSIAQENIPSKYYCLKTYYNSENCNVLKVYWMNKKGSKQKGFLVNRNDSLIRSYSSYSLEKERDSLIQYAYRVGSSFFNKKGITYDYFNGKKEVICQKEFVDKEGEYLKSISKWNSSKEKYYTEVLIKNKHLIKRWSESNKLLGIAKRVVLYEGKHLSKKLLDGMQKAWYPNGKIKYKVFCKEGYVLKYRFYNQEGRLLDSKSFSLEEKMRISKLIEKEVDKKFIRLEESCEEICLPY